MTPLAAHHATVGEAHGWLAKLSRAARESFDVAEAFEQRVLGVGAEVDELGRGHSGLVAGPL
jgi:hypothetical protein